MRRVRGKGVTIDWFYPNRSVAGMSRCIQLIKPLVNEWHSAANLKEIEVCDFSQVNGAERHGAPKITSWLDALNAFEVAKTYVIATVIRAESPSSGKPGDKAVISPDGDIFGWIGGGCAQPVVTKAVADVLSDGKPMIVRISPSTGKTVTENGVRDVHMACHSGGSIELLVEPRLQRRSVLLVGATPVAKKLETVAPMLSIPLLRFEDGTDPNGLFEVAVVATQGKRIKTV